jgi:glycosyltransferase involved in cell wall biosynthesis
MPTPRPGRARGLVIAWMPVSQRSATIADRLGFELVLIGRSGFRRPWTAPLAYPFAAARTVIEIVRRRPRAALLVVPPFLAPWVAWPFLAALRAPFAIDVHSGALLDRRWRWSVRPLRWIARHAVASVVTLDSLRPLLEEDGATMLVIPDPLPDLVPSPGVDAAQTARSTPLVVAICGWAPDEPIEALIAAAAGRPWQLVLTGRPRTTPALPPNVILAGFLPQEAYVDLVAGADAVVVLTTRDGTLLSGGWEAISLARPLVLSGTPALRATFGDEVIYVDATADGIAAGIDAILADPEASRRVAGLRDRFGRSNDAALAALAALLGSDGQSSSAARNPDHAR